MRNLIPHLLPIYLLLAAIYLSWELFELKPVQARIEGAYLRLKPKGKLLPYAVVFLAGGLLLSLYWFAINAALGALHLTTQAESKPSATPTPSTTPTQQIVPTTVLSSPTKPNDLRLSVTDVILEKGDTLRVRVAFRNTGPDERQLLGYSFILREQPNSNAVWPGGPGTFGDVGTKVPGHGIQTVTYEATIGFETFKKLPFASIRIKFLSSSGEIRFKEIHAAKINSGTDYNTWPVEDVSLDENSLRAGDRLTPPSLTPSTGEPKH